MFFSSCHECRTKKKFWVPMRNRTSDLWISHSDALPLSHRDSTVSKVYYEVLMTRALHTARISNVNGIKFGKQNNKEGKFWALYLVFTQGELFQPVKSKCLSWLYQQRKCRKLIPTRICNTMVCIKPSLHTKLISISHKKNDILWPVTFPCEKRYFFLIYQNQILKK